VQLKGDELEGVVGELILDACYGGGGQVVGRPAAVDSYLNQKDARIVDRASLANEEAEKGKD